MAALPDAAMRELLANYLNRQQDTIHARLLAAILEADDLREIQALSSDPAYRATAATLISLLIRNLGDANDRRCFAFARQRAAGYYREHLSAAAMLRLTGLHRQVLEILISRHFADDPALVRQMISCVAHQLSELDLVLSEAFRSGRDRLWLASEAKYWALFENASEAIVSFRSQDGALLEVNMQAERLLGRARSELLGQSFESLFMAEHREQAHWLVHHSQGMGNLRLEEMAVLRQDAMEVPVALSCNWVMVEDDQVAQVIMRDQTQVRQMQRELRNYADQLEARVAGRTRDLQHSEERYRELFLAEQRQSRHLAMLNEVQQCALQLHDSQDFLQAAVPAIQHHFTSSDVTVLLGEPARRELMEPTTAPGDALPEDNLTHGEANLDLAVQPPDNLVVVATAGDHGLSLPPGGRQGAGEGLAGQVVASRTSHFRGPEDDTRHEEVAGVHRASLCRAALPLFCGPAMIGVLQLQSEVPEALSPGDIPPLEAVGAIISGHLSALRTQRQIRNLAEYNRNLVDFMLRSLIVIGRDQRVLLVNDRTCATLRRPRSELQGAPLSDVLGEEVVRDRGIAPLVEEVRADGQGREMNEVHFSTGGVHLVVDLRFFRVPYGGEAHVGILVSNITDRWRQTQQLQMMNEMGRLFQESLDINQVLLTVLTCITAGTALGFNRAFLLLCDDAAASLRGAMALGPASAEEASRIWDEMSRQPLSLEEILNRKEGKAFSSNLQPQIEDLILDLQHPAFTALLEVANSRRAVQLQAAALWPGDHPHDDAMAARARSLFNAPSTAVAPLLAKERMVGMVLADNLYSGSAIEEDDVQLLDTLAQGAGLTIDNARTYEALQKAQRDLVSAERLRVVGEMAARVSHEIRNPLATIGGHARQMLKRPHDGNVVVEKTRIVVDEVTRLERLLNDLLDMARERQLQLEWQSLNEVVEHGLLLAEADLKNSAAQVERQYEEDLPPVLMDRGRILQALLNTIRNGAQAMPEGGVLRLSTRLIPTEKDTPWVEVSISDNGPGISDNARKQIFDPFFSTKLRGSGLGLAITRRIMEDHGGEVRVDSEPGQGTTFFLRLPINREAGSIVPRLSP